MKAYYLITNPKQGAWGRGETVEEAIANCRFTASQDVVHVSLVDPAAAVNEVGGIQGRFIADLGQGKVMADKKRVSMQLAGEAPTVRSVEERLVASIQQVLDGQEWDSDTPLAIADLLDSTGYKIRSPGEQA